MWIRFSTNTPTQRGFTVVELLIVIVVIAVLAAIAIVTYGGVQDRAKASQMNAGIEQYIKVLGLHAGENGSFPVPAILGSIACFDGTVSCTGAATQSLSTALLNAMKAYSSSTSLALPYPNTLLTYNVTTDGATGSNYTGYYILFHIAISQSCPTTLAGARFLNTSTSGTDRTCRMALTTPA